NDERHARFSDDAGCARTAAGAPRPPRVERRGGGGGGGAEERVTGVTVGGGWRVARGHGADRFLSGGRSQSETCAGCIVSCTTASRSACNCPSSTCWRKPVPKLASVFSASYLRR